MTNRVSMLVLLALLLSIRPEVSWADSSSYPDLRAMPPTHLLLDTAEIAGTAHNVLRFSAIIENSGPGRLELRGETVAGRTVAYQRIPADSGPDEELPIGQFMLHPAHHHWHFEHFADYELWTRAGYDAWLASGRVEGQPDWHGSKTTGQGESFCVRDSIQVESMVESEASPVYDDCGQALQGISVGWADVYPFTLSEQWVDLGDTPLADGEYVLRMVADPLNLIYESPNRSNSERESPEANESITFFAVRGGCAEEEGATDTLSELVCGDAEDADD